MLQRRFSILAVVLAGLVQTALGPPAAALPGADRVGVSGSDVQRVGIADPVNYWRRAGFAEMAPAVRLSVASYSGALTRIYLHIPAGATVTTAALADGQLTLRYPPGSEADRVSLVPVRQADGAIEYTVDDVRGTRWDRDGREFYHVYRPNGAGLHAPLRGYEWPKDSGPDAALATDRLVALVAGTPLPGRGFPPDAGSVRHFRRLNNCAACHVQDKPAARRGFTRMPPWATDASGLYTPLAVLSDTAPLSADANFHDPNAIDALVTAVCPTGTAQLHGRSRARFYRCADGAAPLGTRDVARGMLAADPYTADVCASRRYLVAHMDAAGRAHFTGALAACALP